MLFNHSFPGKVLLIFAPIYVTNISTKMFYQQQDKDKDKDIKRTPLKSDPGDVLHLIRVMRRHDLPGKRLRGYEAHIILVIGHFVPRQTVPGYTG